MAFNPYDYLRNQMQRRRREPWDERMPDGTPAMEIAVPQQIRDIMKQVRASQEPQPVTQDAAIATRPRRVFELPPETGTAGRPRFNDPVTYNQDSGMPERRPYNYGADQLDASSKYRDALVGWRPSGGKRGLKNILKSIGYGALTALSENPDNPLSAIGGAIAGGVGGAAKPSTLNWLRRKNALNQADAELKQQLEFAGSQAKLRQAEMNPFFREVSLNQGQQRIDNVRDKMAQDRLLAHKRALASIFNAYPEFDPDDPKNTAIVAAMNAVGLPVTKKTRGSLLQLVQGTDENGNATFSIVHKPTATATEVTGEGLPAKTEQQLGRESGERRARATQEGADRRARMAQEGADRRSAARVGRSGTTTDKAAHRRAAKLIGDIESFRLAMTQADELLNRDPNNTAARKARNEAQRGGEAAAAELNALNAGYEAGPGTAGYPYYKQKSQATEATGKYAGQRISSAKLPEAAKRLGMTIEQARKYLQDEGATIY